MKQFLANYSKNIGGWTTNRKILCFAVDDYGNVRIRSKSTLQILKKENIVTDNRFDCYDALNTKEDLQKLYEILDSVRDKNGKPAIFTTYALPANINFEKVLSHLEKFEYELLPETYEKLSKENDAYIKAWDTLKFGIASNYLRPQFHGREHLNVKLFEHYLKQKNEIILKNLQNKCYAGVPICSSLPTIKFTQSFAFWKKEEIEYHKHIIEDGLKCFEAVYGYKSKTFTPPAQQLHPDLYPVLEKLGILSIDKPRKTNRHLGENKFIKESNKLGIQREDNHVTIVRNAVFEPNSKNNFDWVTFTFKQVQAAFRMNKPAIISSHRVNFCGHISKSNRTEGLKDLKALLCKIVQAYPDVEFIGVDDLAEEIIRTSSNKI